jgi:predicted transcriptional regulator
LEKKSGIMVQFEVVEVIFESENPVSKQELVSRLGLHPSTIEAGIGDCVSKGYIVETGNKYTTADEFDKEKLESIRPKTIRVRLRSHLRVEGLSHSFVQGEA